MRIKSKKFEAKYSAISGMWEIKTKELHFWCRYLRIKRKRGFEAPRNKYQIIKAENVEFELWESWVVLLTFKNLKRKHLWELYNPDRPRNLAKTVTVK